MTEIKKQIEALLFSSGRSMNISDLVTLTNFKEKEVKAALNELKKEYNSRDSSLMLVEEGNSWKLNIRENYVSLVTKIIADTELSKTILETLGVIAWKAPVLQSEIINIRSSQAYDHIKELVDLGFIKKEKEGRSYQLRLAEKFFEYFDVPGEKGIKEALKEVKMPEKKEKLGNMDVVSVPDVKTKETMSALDVAKKEMEKKFEIVDEPKTNETTTPTVDREFLDKIDKNIDEISRKNDELDNDELFRKKEPTPLEEGDLENQNFADENKQKYFSTEGLMESDDDEKTEKTTESKLKSESDSDENQPENEDFMDEDLEKEKDKDVFS